MTNICAFIGEPLEVEGIKIFPPKVKDVLANKKYGQYYKILTFEQDDIAELYKDQDKYPNCLEFMLINTYKEQLIKQLTFEAFDFFCHQKIEFDYENKQIIFSDGNIITEENFFDFQNSIRLVSGNEAIQAPEPIDPNEDPRIRRIKEKARLRDRIKRKKGLSNQGGVSLNACIIALCCQGIGITPMNIGDMSFSAINPLMRMMQDKEKYDLDVRSLLAGAKPSKVKPKYWIQDN